ITIPTWFGFRDTSTAGMMAVAAGFIFLAVFLLAPRYGLLSRFISQTLLSLKITRDDILGFLYRYTELAPKDARPVTATDLVGAMRSKGWVQFALWDLRRRGWIRGSGAAIAPTPRGLSEGRGLIRSHRLWEAYLFHKLGIDADAAHFPAHQLEHFTDEAMQSELARSAENPRVAPHRRNIPESYERWFQDKPPLYCMRNLAPEDKI
ncbi:MAG: metal-dependent transcriptional regulator, partial [Thermodesulfobacteriota bacterium]